MPPGGTSAGSSEQSSNRKKPHPARIVPAIPLSLSKTQQPKPKPLPKADSSEKVEAERASSSGTPADPHNGTLPEQAVVNGDVRAQVGPDGEQSRELGEETAKASTSDTPGSRGSAPMSISDGTSPEPAAEESVIPQAPPSHQAAAATASGISTRKPTDLFDMRHLRTELPPAFIPSAEQHTPQSASSSQSHQPQLRSHGHPSRPSATSIVFGGQASSTPSPAPPLSAGSAYMPPPYPSYGSAQPPSFIPTGHSHNTSESSGQRMYQQGYEQPGASWHTRQRYGPPMQQPPFFHPHAHTPSRYSPREPLAPAGVPQPNGRRSRSRSASQSSSAAADGQRATQTLQSHGDHELPSEESRNRTQDPRASFSGHPHYRQTHFGQRMPPPPPAPFAPHPDIAASLENSEALRNHVLAQRFNTELADCRLQITEECGGSHKYIDAHKIILSRSPTLVALMREGEAPTSGTQKALVFVRLRGQYVRMNAFMEVLKYLYGGTPTPLDHYRPGSSGGEQMLSNVDKMEASLQRIAVGTWLKVPAVAARSLDAAGNLLHWDTIAHALAFAVDGGLSHMWTIEDGSEDKFSTSSSDDSLGRPEAASTPTYDPFSTNLLQRIVHFTVHMLPSNFYLDASAPQLASCARLPPPAPGHDGRPSRSDPRLSQIRFGEIPVEDLQRPSFVTTTISSVLLSLPFSLLKCILEHHDLADRLGPETVASIMRQVVAERETRRVRALKAHVATTASDDSPDAALVQNLYWEELVEASHQLRAGFRLARRRRLIDTPVSSGAASVLNK